MLEGRKTLFASLATVLYGLASATGTVVPQDEESAWKMLAAGAVFFALRLVTKGPVK